MITPEPRPVWVAGVAEQGASTHTIEHPFDGSEVATVAVAGSDQVERAVAAATSATAQWRHAHPRTRADALDDIARGIAARADELAEVITAESGKPLTLAEAEVRRAVSTFRIAATEAGEVGGPARQPGQRPGDDAHAVLVHRVARGPMLGISSYRDPLQDVARHVASALAVGAAIVSTTSTRPPLAALITGEILAQAPVPANAFSVLPLPEQTCRQLTADPRLPVVALPAMHAHGWSLAEAGPARRVLAEAAGTAAAAVLDDWTELELAARRIASSATEHAGQSSRAITRVLVTGSVAQACTAALADAVASQATGDPYDGDVTVGPVIHDGASEHVAGVIADAIERGARLLVGGSRDGTSVEPTVLADVPASARVCQEDVFGPVLAVSIVDSADEAFAAINHAGHRGHASVFTRDVRLAFRASAELDADEVTIGDIPSADVQRAVRDTMRELTEQRTTVLAGIDN